MRALVTGASGFVGSHIVDACLAEGDDVTVLVRATSDQRYLRSLPSVRILEGDLTDAASVHEATRGVDVVYHSAARVLDYGSRRQFHDANVAATRALLHASKTAGVRSFVFVSSPSVVADGGDQLDIDESIPYPSRFLNIYSETKAAAEAEVLSASSSAFTTCAIRPRAVWGPRDRAGYMPKLVAKLLSGRMRDFSGGARVQASLCYCENAAAACLLAARSPHVGGKAYFITDDEPIDVWSFLNTVGALFGAAPVRRTLSPRVMSGAVAVVEALWSLPMLAHNYSPPVSRYGLSLLTRSATYDISAARRDLGYVPRVSVADGLVHLKKWVDAIGGVDEYVRSVR